MTRFDLILAALGADEIAQFPDFVSAVRDVLDESNGLLNALKTTEAWLERWAAHVGACKGGASCTCGLTRARFEAREAITDAEDQP